MRCTAAKFQAKNVGKPAISTSQSNANATKVGKKGNGGARVVGEIINSCADESILTNGKVDIMKLRPIIFHSADASYHVVGDSVGQAWGTGKRFE